MCPATIVLTDACALRTANRGGQHHTAHRGAADGRGGRQPARQPQAPHLELAAAVQDQAPQEGPLGCDFFLAQVLLWICMRSSNTIARLNCRNRHSLALHVSDSGPAPVEAACAILCSLRHLEHVPQSSQACSSFRYRARPAGGGGEGPGAVPKARRRQGAPRFIASISTQQKTFIVPRLRHARRFDSPACGIRM